jgi:nucleoside-diphosphate-sugar epimerase
MTKTVLVAGASGLVGFAAMRALEREAGTRVIATSRRPPVALAGAEWVQADLTDAAGCAQAFGGLREVTHVVFAALYEKPEVIAGWLDPEQIETNGRMLKNLFEPLRAAAPNLEQVILLQGTKAYGAHVRPMDVPARPGRSEARDVPNFYWVQQDYLEGLQAGGAGWGLTILRPQIVFGVAVGGALNPIAAIGAYAALAKAAGEPLHYTGGKAPLMLEGVHADLIGEAVVWATHAPAARGKAYNLTNGDVMTFRGVWPAIADELGMDVGEDRPQRLGETMRGRGDDWACIVAQYGLAAPPLDAFVAQSFQYLDFLLAPGRDEFRGQPPIVSTINLRQDGFHAVWDSEDMLRDCVRQFRALRLLPPRN